MILVIRCYLCSDVRILAAAYTDSQATSATTARRRTEDVEAWHGAGAQPGRAERRLADDAGDDHQSTPGTDHGHTVYQLNFHTVVTTSRRRLFTSSSFTF